MKIKNIIFVCIFLFLLLSPIDVSASNKEYTVDKIQTDVELTENGDAIVEENWTITIQNGSFSRFQKDIYKANNELEEFDFELIDVKMNGVSAKEVNTDEYREPDTYYFSETNDMINIQLYYPISEPKTISYTFKYKLNGVVKHYQNDAYFSYRFVGKNFEKTVEELEINILTPENTPYEIYSLTSSYTYDKNPIVIYENVGLQQFTLKMDSIVFSDLKEISSLRTGEDNGGLLDSLFYSLCFMCVVIVFCAASTPGKFNNSNSSSGSNSNCNSCSSCGGCGGGCGGCGAD